MALRPLLVAVFGVLGAGSQALAMTQSSEPLPCSFTPACLSYITRALEAGKLGKPGAYAEGAEVNTGTTCGHPECDDRRYNWNLSRNGGFTASTFGNLEMQLDYVSCDAGLEKLFLRIEARLPNPGSSIQSIYYPREIEVRFRGQGCQQAESFFSFSGRKPDDPSGRGTLTRAQCEARSNPAQIPDELYGQLCLTLYAIRTTPLPPPPPPAPSPRARASPQPSFWELLHSPRPEPSPTLPCPVDNYFSGSTGAQPIPPGTERQLQRLAAMLAKGDESAYVDAIWKMRSARDVPVLERIARLDPRSRMRYWAISQLADVAKNTGAASARTTLLGLDSPQWNPDDRRRWVEGLGTLAGALQGGPSRSSVVEKIYEAISHPYPPAHGQAVAEAIRLVGRGENTPERRTRLLGAIQAFDDETTQVDAGWQLRELAEKRLRPETRAWVRQMAEAILAKATGRGRFWAERTLEQLGPN